MDYLADMPNENNVDDVLTLSWLRGWLGNLDIISNEESRIKKDGCYEIHDQFFTNVGIQFLVNAFRNYMKRKRENLTVTTEAEAEDLILDFLEVQDIKYYYDPENTEEVSYFDDLLRYSKDICSRTVLSLVLDKVSGYNSSGLKKWH